MKTDLPGKHLLSPRLAGHPNQSQSLTYLRCTGYPTKEQFRMLAWEKLHSVTSQKATVSSPIHSKGRSMAFPHTHKGKEDGPRLTVWLVTFMNSWCPGKSRGKGSVLSPPVSEVQIKLPPGSHYSDKHVISSQHFTKGTPATGGPGTACWSSPIRVEKL